MLRWFPAKHAGKCAECNKVFDVDDQIAEVDGVYVGKDCCDGTGFAAFVKVMPHGKQASDRCPDCFIIHATSQTECE